MSDSINSKVQIFIKAVYAGFMIGIGGAVKLSLENQVIGALLFSFGLMTIVAQGYNLYTGKIGFVSKWKELPDMLIIIIGNYVGTFLIAFLCNIPHLPVDSLALANKKLDNSVGNIFILSILCGIMMYLAIDNYNKTKNIVYIIAPVMIFLLTGFEHSIASMFYFHLAGIYSLKSFGYLFVMLAGNGIGAKLFGLFSDRKKST